LKLFFSEYWVDGEPQLLVWSVNNISDIKSDEPLIGQAYREAQESGWPTDLQGTRALPSEPPFVWDYTQNVTSPEGPGAPVGSREQVVIALEEGDIVEIVLQNARALNGVAEFHPWHAHGHSFWVVGSGEGSFDPATHPATYNLVNPVLRDTLNVWPLQWTAIRLVANNPGVWFFHCHIVSHQLMGMGFVLVTQPDVLEGPPESVLYCGSDNLSGTEGNSTGKTDSASSTLVFHPTLLMILLGSLFLST
jgi:laccase